MDNFISTNVPLVNPENLPEDSEIIPRSNSGKKSGRKKVRRDHTKTYKELQKTKLLLQYQQREMEETIPEGNEFKN